jgi:hypothetical protein
MGFLNSYKYEKGDFFIMKKIILTAALVAGLAMMTVIPGLAGSNTNTRSSSSSGSSSSSYSSTSTTVSLTMPDANGVISKVYYTPAQLNSDSSVANSSDQDWNVNGMNWTLKKKNGSLAKGEWTKAYYGGTVAWYYFGDDNIMRDGFIQTAEGTYYCKTVSDGTRGMMLIGWVEINGKMYYFEPTAGKNQGHMYVNTVTPDGHRVDATGARIS